MRIALVQSAAFLCVLAFLPGPALAFTDIGAGLQDVHYSSAAWGDYDNDGDLDILLTGIIGTEVFSRVYRNDGGSFVDIVAGLQGVYYSSVAWGDYDNDGDLDILLTGLSGTEGFSRVYRNDGGSFVDIVAGLPGVGYSSVAWGDYDNDGDLDILLTGQSGWDAVSRVYRNDGGSFVDIVAGLTGVYSSSATWGDYDNDGDLDILLTGYTAPGVISHVYRNDGGNFVEVGVGLTGARSSSAAWGDYDNDGDLDILLTGLDSGSEHISRVYRNDGGSFVDIVAGLTGVSSMGSAAWGDYDNDGDLDILLAGYTGSERISRVYRNDGGSFVDIVAGLTGANAGSAAWGDYDNDGDLDILLTGDTGSEPSAERFARVYRNDAAIAPNSAPGIPAGLQGHLDGSTLTMSWDVASDTETPAAGLTYNLRVGTTPGGSEVLPGMADSVNGYRRVVARGNTNANTTWTIHDLHASTVYWSVQAVDGAFEGGAFAPEQSVKNLCTSLSDLSAKSQDFEALVQSDLQALANDDWLVWGNVFDSTGATYLYGYGGPAPNDQSSPAFCLIATGQQGGPDQGDQQIVVFSDYNNAEHGSGDGNLIESNVLQEQLIGPGDIGKTWAFEFDAKRGDLAGASTAEAFIKTIDPAAGDYQTNLVTAAMTTIPETWKTYLLRLHIDDPSLCGQKLQFGFRNTASNYEPSGVFYDNVYFGRVSSTNVDDIPHPGRSSLFQASPNPFNPSTTIRFELSEPCHPVLSIYDMAGRHVVTLVDENRASGMHEAVWHGTDSQGQRVSSGVYLYQLRAGEFSVTKRAVLLK